MQGNSSLPRINKRYNVIDRIGAGGMGVVYRAYDRLTGQIVALKRVTIPSERSVFASTGAYDDFRLSLAQEFRMLASLRHPNIISVLDYGFDDEQQPFFTMDLLEGAQTILDAAEGKRLAEQIDLLVQMLQALAYLHRRGVVHRDVKPDNILVINGQVKVLDFGLAMAREKLNDISNLMAGTLAYMAPEIIEGHLPSKASDLYAVGIVAFELFTGQHPFTITSVNGLLKSIVEDPPNIELLDASENLIYVIQRLLTKDPRERYSDAIEVIHALTEQDAQSESDAIRESYLQAAQFVGREGEFKKLTDAVQRIVVGGGGSAWLIGGESGVGKTRLMEEVRIHALVEGVMVLRGQAIDRGGAPYQLWRDMLRRLCLTTILTDLEASTLKLLVPDIDILLGRSVANAPALEPQSAQNRLIGVIEDVFRRQMQPMALLLEDLQWAGDSLVILKALARDISSIRMLIIGAYRDDESPHLRAEFPDMEFIRLERLSSDAIANLSASILGDEIGRREDVITLLQRETEGNAYFIVEVVRVLAEEAGQLARIGDITLPHHVFAEGMKTVIQRRLSLVPADAQILLKAAAIAGRELDLNVLRIVYRESLPRTAAEADLRAASERKKRDKKTGRVDRKRITAFTSNDEASEGADDTDEPPNPSAEFMNFDSWLTTCAELSILEVRDDVWRFAHDKLRDTLLAGIEPDESSTLHGLIAQAIEQAYADDLTPYYAILAYHWEQGRKPLTALDYYEQAGEQAARSFSNQEVIQAFSEAMRLDDFLHGDNKLSRSENDNRRRADWQRRIGESFVHLSEYHEGQKYLEDSLMLSGRSIPRTTSVGLVKLVGQLGRQAMHRIGLKWRVTVPEQRESVLTLSRTYTRLVEVYYRADELILSTYAAYRALNIAEHMGDSPELAEAAVTIGASFGFLGMKRLGEAYHARALRIVEDDQNALARPYVWLAVAYYDIGVGKWAKAEALLNQLLEASERLGDRRRKEDALGTLGVLMFLRGRFDESMRYTDELQELANRVGDVRFQSSSLLNRSYVLLARGQTQQALETVLAAQSQVKSGLHVANDVAIYGNQAIAFCRLKQTDRALEAAAEVERLVAKSLIPSDFTMYSGYAAPAEVYLTLWEKGQAELAPAAKKAYKLMVRYARVFPIGLPLAHLFRGNFEWLSGQPQPALFFWNKGLTEAQRLDMPYETARLHYEIGRHLDTPEAKEHLNRAIEMFTQLGAAYDLERARAALKS